MWCQRTPDEMSICGAIKGHADEGDLTLSKDFQMKFSIMVSYEGGLTMWCQMTSR